jgi:hypothetical protein
MRTDFTSGCCPLEVMTYGNTIGDTRNKRERPSSSWFTVVVWSISLLTVLTGCGPPCRYGTDFATRHAEDLDFIYWYWDQHGRPQPFDYDKVAQTPGVVHYYFTNQVAVDGKVYHCRFAERDIDMPGGLFVVTDEGVFLWIDDKGGEVTVSPEKHGIK